MHEVIAICFILCSVLAGSYWFGSVRRSELSAHNSM